MSVDHERRIEAPSAVERLRDENVAFTVPLICVTLKAAILELADRLTTLKQQVESLGEEAGHAASVRVDLRDRLTKLENAERARVASIKAAADSIRGGQATLSHRKGGDSTEPARDFGTGIPVAPPPSSRAAEGGGERERCLASYEGLFVCTLRKEHPTSHWDSLKQFGWIVPPPAQPAPEPAAQPLPAVAIGGSATGTNEPAVEDAEPNDNKEPSGPVCPVCEGRGELRDAMQAWDVAGAPVPECPYCDEGIITVESLDRLQHGAEKTEPEPSEDVVERVAKWLHQNNNISFTHHSWDACEGRDLFFRHARKLLTDCALARPEGERVEGYVTAETIKSPLCRMFTFITGPHWDGDVPATLILHRASDTGSDE